MLRVTLGSLAAGMAVCMVAGCGASTPHNAPHSAGAGPSRESAVSSVTAMKSTSSPAGPVDSVAGSSTALSARLLADDSVPGFTVKIATVESPDAGTRHPRADAPCSDDMIPLLSGTRLMGTPSAMASATLSNDPASDHFWVGREVLRTYLGNGAEQALTDLRGFIGRCPGVASSGQDSGSFRFAAAPGPRLGDDSVHVSCSMTTASMVLECNSVIVRLGSAVVAVQEQGNESDGDGYLTQLAEAAVRRFQATGS